MMTNTLRVMIETGKKGKRAVAVAPDWPGLSRGEKTEEAAVARLLTYVPRYFRVAELAGMATDFSALEGAEVIGRYAGSGSTDFWGISFGFSEIDHAPISNDELERELALMQAAWAFFDEVRARVSPEMAKGPRGGGKNREQIVRHTLLNEQDWGKKLGLPGAGDETPDNAGLRAHREAYVDAIRAFYAEGKLARTWPLRFLIRHTAFHTLDHAWEMEDKDLTGTSP
jgi:hypothetical protein